MRTRYALALVGLLLPSVLHAQPRPATPAASGIVATERGVPVGSARIVAIVGRDTVRTTTDRSGAFVLATLAPGEASVTASADGFVAQTQRTRIVAGQTAALKFLLASTTPARVTVAGTVVNARTGAPVAGAITTLLDGERAIGADTTDARGAFSVSGPAGFGLSLRVAATGFRSATVPILSIAAPTGFVVRLDPAAVSLPARLSGRITGDEKPLAGALVTLARLDGGGDRGAPTPAPRLATTDATGAYAFDGIAEGVYAVTAKAAGFDTRRLDLRLGSGETAVRSLDLRATRGDGGGPTDPARTATVAGRVLTDSTGRPVGRARVVLMSIPGDGAARSVGTAMTGDDGAFRIAVAPGRYIASVVVSGERGARPYAEFYLNAATPDLATPVAAAAGQTTTITFSVPPAPTVATVTLSGRVTDAAGAPLGGASVWATARGDGHRGSGAARTAADGTWKMSVEATLPAAFVVAAQREGYLAEFWREAARPDSATLVRVDAAMPVVARIDFTLAARPPRVESGALAGTVRGGAAALAGATVVAYNRAAPMLATTGADGGYAFASVAAGPAIVLATAAGYAPAYAPAADTWLRAARVEIGPVAARADVALAAFVAGSGPRRVLGTVRDRRGRPTAAALVRAYDAERRLAAHDLADADGRFDLTGLADGRYAVTVDLPFGNAWTATVDVDSVDAPNGIVNAIVEADGTVLAVDGDASSSNLALDAVSPNPARGSVRLAYRLDAPRAVALRVYDALGRLVLTADAGLRASGTHETTLAADMLAPGVYVVRLDADGQTASRTFVVTR